MIQFQSKDSQLILKLIRISRAIMLIKTYGNLLSMKNFQLKWSQTMFIDKYAVAVKKNDVTVGHLPLGKNGKFAKTIFYFLRADPYAQCQVKIKGKPVNLGDGMQVPCLLNMSALKAYGRNNTKRIL